MQPIYLDYAAATPLDPAILDVMMPFYSEKFYNPSALYQGAREAKAALEEARSRTASAIGARPSEVTFTAGGTESANLAIQGIMDAYPEGSVVVSAIEHDAILKPAHKYAVKVASVNPQGIIDLNMLEGLIEETTVLISVMYANNEVGTVQPIKEITALVRRIRMQRISQKNSMPLYVHTDACQAPLYLDCNVARLGVDLMTLNGGKIYGPKQSGILYHAIGVNLKPQILGGGQELGYRSGTENVAGCVGFSHALERSVHAKSTDGERVQKITQYFIEQLESQFDVIVNGHPKKRLPSTVHVTFPGRDNERMLFSLDDQGVYAAAGSACSASSEEASHVLLAMGVSEENARSSLRFSVGRLTSKEEIDRTIAALRVAVEA